MHCAFIFRIVISGDVRLDSQFINKASEASKKSKENSKISKNIDFKGKDKYGKTPIMNAWINGYKDDFKNVNFCPNFSTDIFSSLRSPKISKLRP